MSVKDSEPDNLVSDLEEGEIPENELPFVGEDDNNFIEGDKFKSLRASQIEPKWGFNKDRTKGNFSVYLQRSARSCANSNVIDGIRKRPYGNDSPPSEGECISDEEKDVGRVQTLKQDLYINDDLMERRARYQPFKSTYGSVEDIMTKIGRTLGRNNNCYYKRRRSKEARFENWKLNGGHAKEIVHRKSSPVIVNKLRTSYYKRRRRSESNSDSEGNRWEKSAKAKNQSVLNRRGKGKELNKKRKYDDAIFGSVNSGEVPKKLKTPEKYQRDFDEFRKKQLELLRAKSFGLNSLPFEEIPLPQEKEYRGSGNSAQANANDNRMISEDAYNDGSQNENSGKNSPNDQNSASDPDEDDTELIKLRLLALSSNKRKIQVEQRKEDDDDDDDLRSESGRGNTNISLDNDDSLQEIKSESEAKSHYDNDIDRNELLLRAEALKTALLNKYQRRIKKQRNCASVDDEVSAAADSPTDAADKDAEAAEESDARLPDRGEEEPSATANPDEASQAPGLQVVSNENVVETTNESSEVMSQEEVKPDAEDRRPSENVNPRKEEEEEEESCRKGDDSNANYSIQNICKENQYLKRQFKRKCARNKRFRTSLSLKEYNIKENKDGAGDAKKEEDEEEHDRKNPRSEDGVGKEATKEHEKKFVLTDSLQSSNILQNVAESKFPPEGKPAPKNAGTEKGNGAAKIAPKVKMPTTELQRIIVHLGSESSEDETTPPRIPSQPPQPIKIAPAPKPEIKSSRPPAINLQNKMIDYEKSVELLLREARLRAESKSQGTHNVPPTPEAVYNHLPPSQRQEYMRLKQKIAERERLKSLRSQQAGGARRIARTGQEASKREVKKEASEEKTEVEVAKKSASAPGEESPSSVGVKGCEKRSPVGTPFRGADDARNDGRSPRRRAATATAAAAAAGAGAVTRVDARFHAKLSAKKPASKSVLENKQLLTQNEAHLERLKAIWKNIKIEKMVKEKYEKETKRLKIQQDLLELKISQQRLKIKKLAEESNLIYEAFRNNNKGVEMMAKKRGVAPLKKTPAPEEKGPGEEARKASGVGEEKTATAAAAAAAVPVPVPVPETEETTKDGNSSEKIDGEGAESEAKKDADEGVAIGKMASASSSEASELKEYRSPLQSLPAGSSESSECPRVDPNTIMCQFDLLGRCNDEECAYQHWRTRNN